MVGLGRSILALVAVAAIVGLIAFARGTPDHGRNPSTSPSPSPAAELQLTV